MSIERHPDVDYHGIRYHRSWDRGGQAVCGPMSYDLMSHSWQCGGCMMEFKSESIEPGGYFASWPVKMQATREATEAEALKEITDES